MQVPGAGSEDASISAAVWYWSNTIQKRLFFPCLVPSSLICPDRKIRIIHNLIWYVAFVVFTYVALAARLWETDFSIRSHMWSKLDVTKPADDGFDGRSGFKDHCTREYARRSEYWIGDNPSQNYGGYLCKPRCSRSNFETSSTSFLNTKCFNHFARTKRMSESRVLVTTHMKRTVTDFILGPNQSQNFWTFSPEKERFILALGFDVPASGSYWDPRSAKAISSDSGFQTFLLNSNGSVFRKIEKGAQVRFTVEELLLMSGNQLDWLDTMLPEAVPNKTIGDRENSNTGPMARLSGGILQLHTHCIDRPAEASVLPVLFGKHVECHISVELVPLPFKSLKLTVVRSDQALEEERHGLTIVTIMGGHFSRLNLQALVLYIFAFATLMEVPRWLLGYLMLHCCGLISKMYMRACYNNMDVKKMISGLIMRLVQIPIIFMTLSESRDLHGHMGVTRKAMKGRLNKLISCAGFHISLTDRSKCLDYLFLMIVKTQLADLYQKDQKVQKRKMKESAEASMEQERKKAEAKAATVKKLRAASQLPASEIDSLTAQLRAISSPDERRIFIESLPKARREALLRYVRANMHPRHDQDTAIDMNIIIGRRKQSHVTLYLYNLASALEDSFSGVNLSMINAALHHGISLGGFYDQCAQLENMRLSDLVAYFQRYRRTTILERQLQPFELSPQGIALACTRGRSISKGTKVWVDDDYFQYQKKILARRAEQKESSRRAKVEAEKRKRVEEAIRQEKSPLDKARKQLLVKLEASEAHQEEAMNVFAKGMHELYHKAAVAQAQLDDINRIITLLHARRSQESCV